MEAFTAAIEVCMNPLAEPSIKEQATQYCLQIKTSTDGWKAVVDMLAKNESYCSLSINVKYFFLQVVEETVRNRFPTLSSSDRMVIISLISSHIQAGAVRLAAEPAFIRNKFALIVACLLKHVYLTEWTTLIEDLLASLHLGPAMADLVVRVLDAVDEVVIDRSLVREEAARVTGNMIKDAIRERCAGTVMDALLNIASNYALSEPDLATSALRTVAKFISWVDISLIVNESASGVLVSLVRERISGNSEQIESSVREAAVECFGAIVHKGMPPENKIIIIRTLGLVRLISTEEAVLVASSGVKPARRIGESPVVQDTVIEKNMNAAAVSKYGESESDDEDENETIDILLALSSLASKVGIELISCSKNLALPSIDAFDLLKEIIPVAFSLFSCDDDGVSSNVLPFLSAYTTLCRTKWSSLTPEELPLPQEHLETTFRIVSAKMRYSSSYNHDKEGENETEFIEFRHELRTLFHELARFNPLSAVRFVSQVVNNILRPPLSDISSMDCELVLHLSFLLGECTGEKSNKDVFKIAMTEIIRPLVLSGVSSFPHRVIQLQYHELVARFNVNIFETGVDEIDQEKQRALCMVLQAFLDHRGLRHTHPAVRSRVSYLFLRFSKAARSHLAPFKDDIISAVLPMLAVVVDMPTQSPFAHTIEDQSFIYEAVANLVTAPVLSGESDSLSSERALFSQLLAPPVQQIRRVLNERLWKSDTEDKPAWCKHLVHLIGLITRLSKGYSANSAMSRSNTVSLFTEALDIARGTLDVPVHREEIRVAVRSLVHRMVTCAGKDVLPVLPAVLSPLLSAVCSPRDLIDLLTLINQLITGFRMTVAPLLDELLMVLVRAVFSILDQGADANDMVTQHDLLDLRKAYLGFHIAVFTSGLEAVYRSPSNIPHIGDVLETFLAAAVEIVAGPFSTVLPRTAFILLRKMVEAWCPSTDGDATQQFVLLRVLPSAFAAPSSVAWDLADASTLLAIADSVSLQKAIATRCGPSAPQQVHATVMTTLGLDSGEAEDYVHRLCASDQNGKNVRSLFKSLLLRNQKRLLQQ